MIKVYQNSAGAHRKFYVKNPKKIIFWEAMEKKGIIKIKRITNG